MNTEIDRRTALGLVAAAGAAAQEPAGAPPDLPHSAGPTGADSGALYAGIEMLSRRTDFSHSFLSGRFQSVEEYRRMGRTLLLEAFGPSPAAVEPKPEILHRDDLGDIVREKIVFSTTPEFRVPAYFLYPKQRRGRIPAIVDLHSHGGMFLYGKEKVIDFGANHPVLTRYHRENYEGRPTATALARRGYAVITIDAFPFGERRVMLDADMKYGWDRSKYSVEDAQYLNGKCRSKESTIVKSLGYGGLTWPGIVAWDDMRTVDYLVTRPEVDARRIGCIGVSMGGYRSLMLAGLDSRIAAACVAGFMSTVKPMIRKHMDTHSFVHFIPGIHARLDLPDIAGLRAPSPLMVLQCRRDGLFPPQGMEEAVEKLAAIYNKAEAPGEFVSRFYDLPHVFNLKMQDDAFTWLDGRLKK